MRNESTVIIHRPVNEVFNFVTNPDNLPQWLKGFKHYQPVSGIPGQQGSRSRQTVEEMGYTVELEEEVVSYRENDIQRDLGCLERGSSIQAIKGGLMPLSKFPIFPKKV